MKIFGDRVKELREDRNLTMGDLARQLGTHQQNVSRWEAGNTIPGGDTLIMLSKFFNVRTDFLLGLED